MNEQTKEQVLLEIKKAIREHEIRVALFSGLGGLILIAGTWHAIYLLNSRF
jgi:hypothetical protein